SPAALPTVALPAIAWRSRHNRREATYRARRCSGRCLARVAHTTIERTSVVAWFTSRSVRTPSAGCVRIRSEERRVGKGCNLNRLLEHKILSYQEDSLPKSKRY